MKGSATDFTEKLTHNLADIMLIFIHSKSLQMDYQMICLLLDIDGILVDSTGVVYPLIKESLKRQWEKICIILSSARPACGIESVLNQIEQDNLYIALNGGLIIPGIGRNPIYSRKLTKSPISYLNEMLIRIINKKENEILSIFFYTNIEWFAWGNKETIKKEEDIINAKSIEIDQIEPMTLEELIKISIVCKDSITWNNIILLLKNNHKRISINKSNHYYIEINHNKATKGNAVNFIKNRMNPEAIISIGDGENDISMFNNSDFSYTIFSASDKVKENSNYVINNPIVRNLALIIDEICSKKIFKDK